MQARTQTWGLQPQTGAGSCGRSTRSGRDTQGPSHAGLLSAVTVCSQKQMAGQSGLHAAQPLHSVRHKDRQICVLGLHSAPLLPSWRPKPGRQASAHHGVNLPTEQPLQSLGPLPRIFSVLMRTLEGLPDCRSAGGTLRLKGSATARPALGGQSRMAGRVHRPGGLGAHCTRTEDQRPT